MVPVISEQLRPILADSDSYAEPFLGGGSMALWVARSLPHIKKLFLNDIDPKLMALWRVVSGLEPGLDFVCSELLRIEPEMDRPETRMDCYNRVRNMVPADMAQIAFQYFFLNKTNWGGKVHSTPIGGWDQDAWQGHRVKNPNKRGVACQFHPKHFVATLEEINKVLKGKVIISTCDALEFIKSLPAEVPSYLDPPYYPSGHNSHYRQQMTPEQHQSLAELLSSRKSWILSYENSETVRNLYQWANITEINHAYTSSTVDRNPKKEELLIMPKSQEPHSPATTTTTTTAEPVDNPAPDSPVKVELAKYKSKRKNQHIEATINVLRERAAELIDMAEKLAQLEL